MFSTDAALRHDISFSGSLGLKQMMILIKLLEYF